MITLLEGPTGGGKSYHAVEHFVLPAIREGRRVVTNLTLNLPRFEQEFGADVVEELIEIVPDEDEDGNRYFSMEKHFDDPWTKQVGDQTMRCWFMIDEAADVLRKGATREGVQEWFRKHRKLNHEVLLIQQDRMSIEIGIRRNANQTVTVANLQDIGLKRYRAKTSRGSDLREIITNKTYRYEDRVFEYYVSRDRGGGEGENLNKQKAVTLWLMWPFLMMYGMAAIAAVMFIFFDPLAALNPAAKARTLDPSEQRQPQDQRSTTTETQRSDNGQLTLRAVLNLKGEKVYMVSLGSASPRRVQPVDLRNIGVNLRPASGCAVYAIRQGRLPKLVFCGDPIPQKTKRNQ